MAAKKKPAPRLPSKPKAKGEPVGPCLFLGCFFFDRPGEPEHTGTFQLVVEASSPDQAADRCLARLRKLRAETTLFNDPSTIYLEGLIRLTGSFVDGLLVNYECRQRPAPPDWQIGCLIPEQDDHDAASFGREPKKNGDMEPFVDFGGQKYAKDLEAAAAKRAGTRLPADAEPRRLPAASPAGRTADARKRTAAERAERRAAREREAQRKKEQHDAVSATLAELEGSRPEAGRISGGERSRARDR
jgi:hypothetical protein